MIVMSQWWPRLLILLALALVLGAPLLLGSADDHRHTPASGDTSLQLVIVTPHNEQIRQEFSVGFNAWRASQNQPAVQFDWRSGGGTSDLRRQVLDAYMSKAKAGRENDGIGYDLFFGGGDFEHGRLASGIALNRDGKDVKIPVSVPAQLPPGLLQQAFPEDNIGGERLYHKDLLWVGAVLSSFGIVFNRDTLAMLNLPEPTTWSDMQAPQYRHWIALADPGHSGSIAQTYNTILRRLGWTQGWRTLRRTFANSRYFTASSSKVPVDVSAGEAAAGMCIDFYGRYQAGAIGGNRVGYVDPAFMTAITADPISVLRGAPHPELAHQFVAWLLSVDAQRLWQRKVGSPGGPQRYELRRLPIRRDMYNPAEMEHWVDPVNPFSIARPVTAGVPDFYNAVAPLAHAMAIDVHADLKDAWGAIVQNPEHPQRARMLELFDAMPPELTVTVSGDGDLALEATQAMYKALTERWKDEDQRLADRLAWTAFFRSNYQEIVRLAGQR
jgi:ABC-type Fe3+ transport system substrate-binding protein